MAGAAYNRGWRNMADPLPTEPCHSNVSSSPDRPEPPSGIYIYIYVHVSNSFLPHFVVPFEKIAQNTRVSRFSINGRSRLAVFPRGKEFGDGFARNYIGVYWKIRCDFIDNSKIFHDRDFRVYNKKSDYVTIIKIPENFEQQRDRGKLISSLRNMK